MLNVIKKYNSLTYLNKAQVSKHIHMLHYLRYVHNSTQAGFTGCPEISPVSMTHVNPD